MNINLTPVSDSPKTKSAVSTGTDATSATSDVASTESGGFFAAFSKMVGDLIDGDEPAEGSTVEAVAKDGKPSESSDTKVSKGKSDTGDESADELLKQASDSDESSSKVTSKKSSDDETVTKVKGASSEKESKDADVQSSKQATKTVTESDELLGRLNESNNALQAKDGKALPQQGEDKQKATKVAASAAGVAAVKESTPETAVKAADPKDPKQISAGQDTKQKSAADIPESVKPFIEKDQLTTAKNAPVTEAQPHGAKGDPVSVGKKGAAAVTAQQGANQLQQSDNAAPVAKVSSEAQPIDGVVQESKSSQQVSQLSQAQNQQPLTQQQAQVQAAQPVGQNSNRKSDQEALAAASVGAGAIMWNNPSAVEQANLEQAALQANRTQSMPPQNQAAVAASVQQALNQSPQAMQAQAMSAQAMDKLAVENMATAMPADLTQAQLQQMVAANGAMPTGVHGQANNQAALKAALGLKAANSINGGQASDPKDAALAQQIALATGQQQGISPARAEATAQAQLPMQLSREMASDQVAERVQMMMSKNLKNIDIRLDPPELGRMQIRMNMNGDNTSVHFNVTNPQAREVIEQSMPRLREMLAQQGVQLGDTSVQQQSAGQQQGRYAGQDNEQSGQGSGNNALNGEENLDSSTKVDLNVTTKRDGISYYA
ncbi:flagellar hook-length control protein FliK [Vibrio lamellibrachiae]|uniref:flagellar hook-length control protein FliK n=1 Tax=Vibrio lamellibrachiae TaxID=2910253 RepID=UPI003D0CB6BE